MTGWIKMTLGTEVDLGPGDIVLYEDIVLYAPPDQRGGGTAPPILVLVLWPNGCMDQDATWYGDRPRPSPHCVGCGTKRYSSAANFRPMSVVAKRLDGSRCHLI